MKTLASILLAALFLPSLASAASPSRIEILSLESKALAGTKTGVDPRRSVYVYLPPGYEESGKRYPVVYFLHSIFWSAKQSFADDAVRTRLDRAIAAGTIRPFIYVTPEYGTAFAGSFYENSSTTGRWLDYTMKEVLPLVEERFRIDARREARGLVGEFMGGRGAFALAMLYPDTFGVLYALHPVATGTGLVPMMSRPDWAKIHRAKSYADLEGDGITRVFLAMAQAFLPNPSRPPFYCDFMVEMENGAPTLKPDVARRLRQAFSLDEMLPDHAAALRSLRAIKLDWTRYDDNQDHVYANQAFTRKLDEFGVKHEAEEYGGGMWWRQNWIAEEGRFDADVLPFLARHLAFDGGAR